MANDDHRNHVPERPRSEPEIIPPGSDQGPRESAWTQDEYGYGVHRIYVARPGLPSILLGLFILGAIAALVILVIAGALLLAFPLFVAGVLLALFYGPVRYHWCRLLDRFAGQR